MKFIVRIRSGGEVVRAGMPNPGPTYYGGAPPESGCWKLDTVGLQDYIDQQIAGQSFGDSVDVFWFAFELADLLGWGTLFTANSEYMSYRRNQKILISVGQLDWLDVKDLDARSQFERFSEALLMSVRRIAQMKRKPRDFDFDRLENTLRTILSACPVADFSCSDQLHD